ncbi:MAG: YraN family protein [Bacteroidales bacterium]|nr:YraN family protein [Bacteroidales bacterium]
MAYVKFRFAQKERSLESRQEAKELGATGEQMATRYLVDNGFVILENNYHNRHKEVDIIALDQGELVFVEVKTRSTDYFMQPEEAVNHQKRQNLIRVANQYIRYHKRHEAARFDVIAIVKNDKETRIKHIKNAFNVFNY